MAADKRSILSVFIEQASKYPTNVAIEDGNTVSTFDELLNQVKGLSPLVWQHRAKDFLPPESRFVCVLLPQGRLFLQSTLSVFGAGGVCVPLGIGSTPSELELVLADLGHPLLITQENILQEKKFMYDNCLILSNEWQDDIDNSQVNFSDFTFQENEFAYAYFTSGSTGQPKAVLHRHHIFLKNVYQKQEMMSLSIDDKSCLFLNPAFIVTTQEMWPVLLSGGRLVVAPPYLRYDIREFRKWVKESEISILTLVSSMAVAFYTQTTHLSEFSPMLRWVYTGGESLLKIPQNGLPFSTLFVYGATETVEIAFNVLQNKSYGHYSMGKIPVGRATDGYDILIVSEDLEVVPDGVAGEVCVAGEHIGSYVNRPELMAQKFVSLCGQRAYRTGDLGYKDADGDLFLIDRMDNVVKLSGHKFAVGELEIILCQHPSIQKAVAAVQKSSPQPKIHVFYTLKTEIGKEDLRERLYDFLKDKIPHYAFPTSFRKIQTIPLNSNGKTDKQKLLSLLSETEKKHVEPVETKNEKNLAEIWSKVLRIPISEIGKNDHFFGLGGSSIQIGEVLELIKALGELPNNVELTAAKFFAHPTIKKFSFYLDHPQDELKIEVNQVNFSEEMATYEGLIEEIVLPKEESKFAVGEGGILLTGATGYFGSSLLVRLLEKYPCRPIYCLVRAISANDAETRVLDNMKKFGISPPILRNCVFLTGNISHPFLGLQKEEYNILSKSIEEIFHTAAEVHFLKDYEFLKASNVQGTIEILKFASQSRLKVLHYMSTLGIFGFVRNSVHGVISENIVPEPSGTEIGYEQTKCMAENIALMGKRKGIPTRIYRLGVIGPHSTAKIGNPNDFLLLLLQASIFLQSFPKLQWKFPFVTLDFAVEAILTLAAGTFAEDDLKTFHIFQKMITLEEIGSILASGRQMGQLASSEWITLLLKVGDSHPHLLGLVQVLSKPFHSGLTFFQLPHSERWNFENKETLQAIRNCGSEMLIISDELILNSIVDSLKINL